MIEVFDREQTNVQVIEENIAREERWRDNGECNLAVIHEAHKWSNCSISMELPFCCMFTLIRKDKVRH